MGGEQVDGLGALDGFNELFTIDEVLYAEFPAVITSFKSNTKSGVLELQFSVDPGDKWEAFKVTDLIGEMLRLRVFRLSYGLDDDDLDDFDLDDFDLDGSDG